MEELAHSVGDEKIPGQLAWDTATVVYPNTDNARPLDSISTLGREGALSLLSQKIARLPPWPKKILAMHYHEHLPLSEIAACIGVSESLISQIHAQTVALLRNYLWRASKPASGCLPPESDSAVLLPPRRNTSPKK
jgi:DNA-directed RNA polymerase specialized sigma24 family protein